MPRPPGALRAGLDGKEIQIKERIQETGIRIKQQQKSVSRSGRRERREKSTPPCRFPNLPRSCQNDCQELPRNHSSSVFISFQKTFFSSIFFRIWNQSVTKCMTSFGDSDSDILSNPQHSWTLSIIMPIRMPPPRSRDHMTNRQASRQNMGDGGCVYAVRVRASHRLY